MTTKPKESEVKGLFDNADVIHSYTRAEALADGVLVDVSERAREMGFRHPVALTSAVWGQYVEVPRGVTSQDETGRLWDILWMTYLAARSQGSERELLVKLVVRNSNDWNQKPVTLKAVCHPGDNFEPVITIMLPEED